MLTTETPAEAQLQEQRIGDFMTALASREPAPGGGAVAGLNAALGGALVSMVCNLTVGRKRFQDVERSVQEILADSETLRLEALQLAAADAEAFAGVAAAYRLPKATPHEATIRIEHIQDSLKEAAQVPLQTALTAGAIVDLCERLVDIGNPTVITDVAVAASCCRSAIESAILNVSVNLALLTDEPFVSAIKERLRPANQAQAKVATVIANVEKRIG